MRKNIVSKLLGVGLLSLCLVSCGKTNVTNVSETKTPREEVLENYYSLLPDAKDFLEEKGYEIIDANYLNSYDVDYRTLTLTYITSDEVEHSITLKDNEKMDILHLYDTKDKTVVENIKQEYIIIIYGLYQGEEDSYDYYYLALIGAIYNN